MQSNGLGQRERESVTVGSLGGMGLIGRMQLIGIVVLAALTVTVQPMLAAQTVKLDRTFAGDGFRTFDFGGMDEVQAVFVDDDGGITLAGTRWGDRVRIILIRLTDSGRLDRRFANDGRLIFDPAGDRDGALAWDRAADGTILMVGRRPSGFYIMRFAPDGAVVPFGRRPYADGSFGSEHHLADIVAMNDGSVLVLGWHERGGTLLRFRTDGRLMRRFGENGVVRLPLQASRLAVPDGTRIVVAGDRNSFELLGLTLDGDRDRTFGRRGRTVLPPPAGMDAIEVNDLAVDRDGRLVLAGRVGGSGFASDGLVARFRPNGALDRSSRAATAG